MHLVRLSLVIPVALALSGCFLWRGEGPPPPPSLTSLPPSSTAAIQDDLFLASALARTNSELDLAALVAQKDGAPAVKRYAAGIAEHRAPLRDQLVTLAQAGGVVEDPNLRALHGELAPLKGDTFDRVYLASQIENQQNNLDVFRSEAAIGSNVALRELAQSQVAQLEQDLGAAVSTVTHLPLPQTTPTQTDYGAGGPGLRRR